MAHLPGSPNAGNAGFHGGETARERTRLRNIGVTNVFRALPPRHPAILPICFSLIYNIHAHCPTRQAAEAMRPFIKRSNDFWHRCLYKKLSWSKSTAFSLRAWMRTSYTRLCQLLTVSKRQRTPDARVPTEVLGKDMAGRGMRMRRTRQRQYISLFKGRGHSG
jgi:hypothetical protein